MLLSVIVTSPLELISPTLPVSYPLKCFLKEILPVTSTDDAASYLDIYYGYTASGTPLTLVDSFKVGAKGYSFKLKEGVYDSTKVYTLSVVDQNGKSIKWSGSDTLTTSYTSYRPNNDTTSVTITLTITDKA